MVADAGSMATHVVETEPANEKKKKLKKLVALKKKKKGNDSGVTVGKFIGSPFFWSIESANDTTGSSLVCS